MSLQHGVRAARPFVFRKFVVTQDTAAMKVSEETVLLGALAARDVLPVPAGAPSPQALRPGSTRTLDLPSERSGAKRILDVGCGTGVLALMLRQAAADSGVAARVVGLDIDEHAVETSRVNFQLSPWEDMQVVHGSLQRFAGRPRNHGRYDVVLCNPPFFPRPPGHAHMEASHRRHLARPGGRNHKSVAAGIHAASPLWPQSRAHARFADFLPPAELMRGARRLLSPAPGACLWLLHAHSERGRVLAAAAEAGLQPSHTWAVRSRDRKPFTRFIARLAPAAAGRRAAPPGAGTDGSTGGEITIGVDRLTGTGPRVYTEQFAELVSEWYGHPMLVQRGCGTIS